MVKYIKIMVKEGYTSLLKLFPDRLDKEMNNILVRKNYTTFWKLVL